MGTVGAVATQDGVRDRLRSRLTAAMKERDMATVKAFRSVLGAIDNAEAVDALVEAGPFDNDGRIAGAVAGGGGAEARRRDLTEADMVAVVRTEIDDRLDAASDYDATGHAGAQRAALLRAEAATLACFLDPNVDNAS